MRKAVVSTLPLTYLPDGVVWLSTQTNLSASEENKFVVNTETVVVRLWKSETRTFECFKRVRDR